MNYNKTINDTNIRIGEVRFSYPHVLEAAENMSGKLQYSCCILIPKDNAEAVQLVKNAMAAAKERGKEEKWNGKIPREGKGFELRDGDDKADDADGGAEEYRGCWFLNANSSTKKRPFCKIYEDGEFVDAFDEDDFHAGDYGAAVISCYPYEFNGSKGLAWGLTGVIKTRDGERLGGGGINEASALADF